MLLKGYIAVNALQDKEQAEKIVSWLQRETDAAWEDRENIKPSRTGAKQPAMLDVLKPLPKINCGECGEATCMVFAVRVTEGAKEYSACPALDGAAREKLTAYVSQFHFD